MRDSKRPYSAIPTPTLSASISRFNKVASIPPHVRAYLEKEGLHLRQAGRDGYDHFTYIRDRFNRDHDPLDFLFLSRAGFNGMMRFNKKGEWNIPFCKKPERFSRSYITKIVNQVRDVACLMQQGWTF